VLIIGALPVIDRLNPLAAVVLGPDQQKQALDREAWRQALDDSRGVWYLVVLHNVSLFVPGPVFTASVPASLLTS
jgi:hypothetical protein